MHSRTRVPFSQPAFSSPAAWDTAGRRPELGLPQGRRLGPGASQEEPSLESSGAGHPTQEHMAGFTVIAPDQIRRDKITRIAKKELEDLEKWKQQQRSRPIHTKPNKLGGNQSEAEARKKQQCQLLQSKYQQKLKREECIRMQKEVEEAKLQAIKAIQREKGELLEFKRQWQEEERTKAHQREQRRVNNAFLDRIEGKSQPSGLHQFGGFGNMNCGKGWGI
uniref:Epithelial stromal interaction 1 n=1 Tax=Vombatus ursinus TaxID=29139 RepID=A0A4X2KSZ9_VOMUR